MTEFSENLAKSSKDPQAHIAALASFARLNAPPQSAQRLIELSGLALPYIDRFIAGDKTDEVYTELRALFPAIQESLKALADMIAPVMGTEIFNRGAGWDLRTLIHAGAHIQAALWGLFPDSPEALANPTSEGEQSWAELLDWNILASQHTLLKAAKLTDIWQQIIAASVRTTNAST